MCLNCQPPESSTYDMKAYVRRQLAADTLAFKSVHALLQLSPSYQTRIRDSVKHKTYFFSKVIFFFKMLAVCLTIPFKVRR